MSLQRSAALHKIMPLGGYSDDGTAVTVHADGQGFGYTAPTPQEIAAAILSLDPPTPYHLFDGTAWVEDLAHAKTIRMAEFREARKEIYNTIGIEHLKAYDNNELDKVNVIKAKRQELRDIPQAETWTGCTTIDDIANYTPAILTEDFSQL